ncbi:MAG TPA: hypothetical protein VGF59_15940 [Bryobacteraceae bacterium]
MTGNTTIGDRTRSVAVVGRLVFDDSGNVSGTSSASFTGITLGNPVTGKYEAHWDCSVTWSLQDDSGGYQHFAGTMSTYGRRVVFRQTDPGGAVNGILLRTMDGCSEAGLKGKFDLTISGRAIDVDTAIESGYVSQAGLLTADGAGGVAFLRQPDTPLIGGSYRVRADCSVELTLESEPAMHFRAILVDEGREVLGIQTDPGTTVTLRMVGK